MNTQISPRKLSVIAGLSYLIIFFSAIFANFFVIEKIIVDPLLVENNNLLVRFGIVAFLVTVLFDVVVAWALFRLYQEHYLSSLSTFFRLIHAIIMGIAVFKLAEILYLNSSEEILNHIRTFNMIWLIGLFFFGFHLILLGKIMQKPKPIIILITIAGLMYIIDSLANFIMPNYDTYASFFLTVVAITSIIGEMSLTIWLLTKSGKEQKAFD